MTQFHLARLTLTPATHAQAAREVPPGPADRAPGFVWRYRDKVGQAFAKKTVDLTLWDSLQALRSFVQASPPPAGSETVLWWHPAGGPPPTLADAEVRMEQIQMFGACMDAFDLSRPMPQPRGGAH